MTIEKTKSRIMRAIVTQSEHIYKIIFRCINKDRKRCTLTTINIIEFARAAGLDPVNYAETSNQLKNLRWAELSDSELCHTSSTQENTGRLICAELERRVDVIDVSTLTLTDIQYGNLLSPILNGNRFANQA